MEVPAPPLLYTPPLPPSSLLTYRYLKLQLPCLGGCDVTGGISNVIPVSRRDRSRKCLMNDEALCSDCPDVSRAARGGKGFLKSCPSISEPGGSPQVHMNQREGYHIHIRVCVHFCLWTHTHTYSCVLSFIHYKVKAFPFLQCILFAVSTHTPLGADRVTVLFFIGHLSHLAGEVAHFSLLHNLSDFPPVIKHSADMWLGPIPSLIIIYLRSQSRRRAGGCALTARQQSVVFYHLGLTGISTTRVPDLDTSLAINGLKTLAACHTGQDGRQSARPAASMIAGACSPRSPPFVSVSRAQYALSLIITA